jgi:hypothetical protein
VHEFVIPSRKITIVWTLNLDDISAEIGEVSCTKRRRDSLFEGDNADAN